MNTKVKLSTMMGALSLVIGTCEGMFVSSLIPLSAQQIADMQAMPAQATDQSNAHPKRGYKRTWTPEEEQTIRSWVAENGTESWTELAKLLPGRSDRQCRERWKNYLDPTLSQVPWSQQEDDKLLQLHEKYGE